jgi:hypothetical protein
LRIFNPHGEATCEADLNYDCKYFWNNQYKRVR